jgi:hypothetical protein
MISIHDLITYALPDKNYRPVEPSCSFYKLSRSQEAFFRFSPFDLCSNCRDIFQVSVDEQLDDIARRWMKRTEETGDILPIPKEIVEKFNRMSLEIAIPDRPDGR